MTVQKFISLLRSRAPGEKGIFNPWRDYDREHETAPSGPEIRARQLAHYLEARAGKAKFLLVAEALGYQGGHFTGIAMTSERILLGHCADKGIRPRDVLPGLEPVRTSRPELRPDGFSEPTATIVWSRLLESGLRGTDFVLWNAVPWHPYNPAKGFLSNRKPSSAEEACGMKILKSMLELFPGAKIIALGNVSHGCLEALNQTCGKVRHPAQGGASLFRSQIAVLLKSCRK